MTRYKLRQLQKELVLHFWTRDHRAIVDSAIVTATALMVDIIGDIQTSDERQ